jgi:mono/diheme cytochrome c family protein
MKNREFLILSRLASNPRGKVIGLVLLLLLFGLSAVAKAQEPLEPPSIPDAESGSRLFADRCINCHGPAGEGNGEMAGDLPMPPRDFTDDAYRRTAVPATMFQTITEGRLDAGMPPFGSTSSNPIPEADRWDLAATVFSLGLPPETVDDGRIIYEENCLSCHGEQGMGDGLEASDQETQPTDLTDLRYWSSRSNEMVFSALQDEGIPGHSYKLDDDELWDVTDYSRTFSYDYFDPQAALEPIEMAIISGLVTNGSTGEIVDQGMVTLRAFTTDLEEVMTETTTVQPDGQYSFELSNVAPDLVYMTSVEYDDLSYNGSPDRMSRSEPALDMPIVVFKKTTDPSVVSIEQVHMVLEFVEDRVMVSEIYIISNNDTAVFVGETGDADDGVFELALPSGAENANFQRSFGSVSNFLPASEVIQTDSGWVDTVPLRPGERGMNLLATYDIPYEDGVTIAHPLFYDAANATILMPDVGISVQEGDWIDQGTQQMGAAGTFLSYARSGLEADEELSFELDGRVNRANLSDTASAGTSLDGDSITGLIIGASVFLLVVIGAAFTVRSWQNDIPEAETGDTEQLLQAVANLDDAYAAGAMDESQYQKQREKLVSELAGMW